MVRILIPLACVLFSLSLVAQAQDKDKKPAPQPNAKAQEKAQTNAKAPDKKPDAKAADKKPDAKAQDKKAENKPAAKKPPAPSGRSAEISDEAVEKAIEQAVAYIFSKQKPDGSWPTYNKPGATHYYPTGPTALCVYALLEAGVSAQDPRIAKALAFMEKTPDIMIYSIGLRCQAWLAASKVDRRYREPLRKETRLLISVTRDGSYGYEARFSNDNDNSTSQYGLLGVWAGAIADEEVPASYWDMVRKHWQRTQTSQGAWCYKGSDDANARPTMAAAGLASLYVCIDNTTSQEYLKCNSGAEDKAIAKGLEWFSKNFSTSFDKSKDRLHYYLYGLERVGLACGYKYFGTTDWYKAGVKMLLASQKGSGEWSGEVNTSFAVLFLVRGRNPVVFNKLQYDGDWNNRPRDLAAFTNWMSRAFERSLNWQIVNLKVPVEDLHDAPILYISGSTAPNFSDTDIEKLRAYVLQGGTIVSVTECNGKGFKDKMREVYAELFPGYKLEPVDPKSELRTIHHKLRAQPQLMMISNGVRPLAIHTDYDMSRTFQMRSEVTEKFVYEALANIVMYITDKGTLRNRGTTLWPDAKSGEMSRKVKLARVKYDGNWDPEPLAYDRFKLLMNNRAGTTVDLADAVEIKDLASSEAKVAVLTGVDALKLAEDDKAALKKYVEDGGLLVIDAAGGSTTFDDSARDLLKEMFGARSLQKLSSSSPLLMMPNVPNMAIEKVKYRAKASVRRGGSRDPNLQVVMVGDRPGVIYSREDLSTSLLGIPMFNCDGYDSESAFAIMRNIALLAATAPPASAPAK